MFLIGKSGLCIFHRHFFADRMHNWPFPLFMVYIYTFAVKKNTIQSVFFRDMVEQG